MNTVKNSEGNLFKKTAHRTAKSQKSGFVRNTLVLVSGDSVAQAIAIGLMPLITRLFAPDAFGIFYITISITGILAPISSLRFNMAIQLPKDEKDADALALLCFFLVVVISLLLFAAVFFWGKAIAAQLKTQTATVLLYAIPVLIFLKGIVQIFNPLLLRSRRFKTLAFSKVAFAGTDKATCFGLGHIGIVLPGGLVAARAVGYCIEITLMLVGHGIRGIMGIFSRSSFNRLMKVMKRYQDFPKYLWSALLQRMSMELPVLMFGFFFSPAAVGYFALSQRMLHQPIDILGTGLANSYFQRTSEYYRNGRNLSRISERFAYVLMAAVSLPLLLLGTAGAEIFSLAFGEKWQEAGFYAQLLAPMYITTFLFRPISKLFDVLEKQRAAFAFNSLFFATTIVSLIPGGLLKNPTLSIGLYSFSTTVIVTTRIVWLLSQIGISPRKSLFELGRSVFRACIFATPVIILKYYANAGQLSIIGSVCLIFVLYFFYLFHFDSNVKSEIHRIETNSPKLAKLIKGIRSIRIVSP